MYDRWTATVLLAGGLAALAHDVASAQLRDCAAIGRDPAAYKVVLGEVSAPGDASRERDAIRDRLRFKLRTQAESLQLTAEQRQLRAAVCDGRAPDESAFSGDTLDDLSRLGVVMEVWGTVLPVRGAAAAAAGREAHLNFAVISLLRFEPSLGGFFDLTFVTPVGAPADVVLKDNVELEALATLALAVRYRRDKRYDAGARTFCEAQSHISRSAQQAATADVARWTALREYAVASRAALVTEAIADPQYSGGLKVSGTARGCGP
jgi:hypothetical protein